MKLSTLHLPRPVAVTKTLVPVKEMHFTFPDLLSFQSSAAHPRLALLAFAAAVVSNCNFAEF